MRIFRGISGIPHKLIVNLLEIPTQNQVSNNEDNQMVEYIGSSYYNKV